MFKKDENCFESITGFNDKHIMLVGIPLASILVSMLLFNKEFINYNWAYLAICIPISFAYTSAHWFVLRFVYKRVRKRYPEVKDLVNRILWMLLVFFGTYFLINTALTLLFGYLLVPQKKDVESLLAFTVTLILSTLVLTIYEAITFYLQLQRTTAEKDKLEHHYVQSQLAGLRNQVNPHFLFNSLNTLSYLIPEDTERAIRFVQQLSKVYRYVLESRDSHVIPLQDEMLFLKSYIFLLNERFGDNLQVQISEIENAHQIAIVPLSMQILFENAIKHNVISKEKPLLIEVFRNNGSIVVRNKLQIKQQVMDSTGVGLENIEARYKMLSDKSIQILQDEQFYTVHLPIIELQKI